MKTVIGDGPELARMLPAGRIADRALIFGAN
jgi:hypothetical protein